MTLSEYVAIRGRRPDDDFWECIFGCGTIHEYWLDTCDNCGGTMWLVRTFKNKDVKI